MKKYKRRPVVTAETVDEKVEVVVDHVARAKATLRAHQQPAGNGKRKKELERLVKEGADILDVVGMTNTRHYSVLLLHLADRSMSAIARELGYKHPQTVDYVLRKPEIVYLKRAIQKKQLDDVISGRFGAKAAAVAAAPKIMANVIEKAGGGKKGLKAAAPRDADMLKAAGMALKSADVNRELPAAHGELYAILKDFSPEELDALRTRREWPARYHPVVKQLGFSSDGSPPASR